MKENCKRKLFISGPVTDTPYYWQKFEEARDFYETKGYAVMIPSVLPVGMANADYARVCMAMIDSADEVAFLPGWHDSVGSKLEHDYCYYTRKPVRLYSDDISNDPSVYAAVLRSHCVKVQAAIETLTAGEHQDEGLIDKAVRFALEKGYSLEFSDDSNGWYTLNLNAPAK